MGIFDKLASNALVILITIAAVVASYFFVYRYGVTNGEKAELEKWKSKMTKLVEANNQRLQSIEDFSRTGWADTVGRIDSTNIAIDKLAAENRKRSKLDNVFYDKDGKPVQCAGQYFGKDFSNSWNAINKAAGDIK